MSVTTTDILHVNCDEINMSSELDVDRTTHPQTLSYKCRFCGKLFDSLFGIKNHIDTLIREMMSCTKCGMAFINKTDFDLHVQMHHSQRAVSDGSQVGYSSQIESTRENPASASQSLLSTLPHLVPNRHTDKRHDQSLKPPMIQTGSQTQAMNELRAGKIVTERKKESHNKRYRSQRVHRKNISTPERYTDLELNTKTFTKQILSRLAKEAKTGTSREIGKSKEGTAELLKQCTGENSYGCVFCGRVFESLVDRNTHMGTHVGGRLHRCNNRCTHKTSQNNCRIFHFRGKWQTTPNQPVHTAKNSEVHKCSVCSKRFSEEVQLHNHKKTHIELHKCTECKEQFTKASDFKAHTKTHMGENSHHCSQCCKCFAKSSTLKVHLRSHTGEKPHGCSRCGKQFTVAGHLHEHMLTHSDLRPYKCSTCNMSFRLPSHLKSHLLTHTGEKPYRCLVCSKRFTKSGNLHFHMKTHTGEIAHECGVCQKGFLRLSHLNQHLLIHTRQNQNATSNKPMWIPAPIRRNII